MVPSVTLDEERRNMELILLPMPRKDCEALRERLPSDGLLGGGEASEGCSVGYCCWGLEGCWYKYWETEDVRLEVVGE